MDNYHLKNCYQCGKELNGRIDKRFCDAYCRNTYNNQNKTDGERVIAETNTLIRRNRKILKDLCPIGKATVRKEVLDFLSYDFRYFSGLYQPKAKQKYYVYYDYAMSPIIEIDRVTQEKIKKVLIVQRQAYFDKYQPDIWT